MEKFIKKAFEKALQSCLEKGFANSMEDLVKKMSGNDVGCNSHFRYILVLQLFNSIKFPTLLGVYLFGAVSSNEAGLRSDIDLILCVIEGTEDKRDRFDKLNKIVSDLYRNLFPNDITPEFLLLDFKIRTPSQIKAGLDQYAAKVKSIYYPVDEILKK